MNVLVQEYIETELETELERGLERIGDGLGEEEAQDRQPHICEMMPVAVRRCEEGRDARANGQDQGN